MRYESFALERLRDILELGMAMHAEGDYQTVPFDIEKTAHSIIEQVIKSPDGFGVLVYDGDNAVGMLAGGISQPFFSYTTYAYDYVWYMLPKYRGARASIRMLNMFKEWALEKGCDHLWMGVSTNINVEKTGRLFEKLGFRHIGGNYKVTLNG